MFEDSENIAKKPEKIVLDVFNEDAVNIYQESFKYGKDDYNIARGLGSKLYISTDDFDLSSSNSSLIKYDNRLKNYVKDYENIISSDTGSTNEKSKLIYKDILKNRGKKDVLIVTNNKGYIRGVFIAENSIGYDWNTYIIDNYYLDVYNAGSVIYDDNNK